MHVRSVLLRRTWHIEADDDRGFGRARWIASAVVLAGAVAVLVIDGVVSIALAAVVSVAGMAILRALDRSDARRVPDPRPASGVSHSRGADALFVAQVVLIAALLTRISVFYS